MNILAASRWTAAVGALMSMLVLWALFVVPTGPPWAGVLWLAGVGVTAMMASALSLAMRTPAAGQVVHGAALAPAATVAPRPRRWL